MSFEINDNIKFNLITHLKLINPPLIAILVGGYKLQKSTMLVTYIPFNICSSHYVILETALLKSFGMRLLSCVLYSGFCSSCKN